ncbi:response regulator containing a CheY-like receiver domain and an HTH DNA-binding domain [Sphaerochaeta pleomorpha str. Grapes]|uniref:Response regulator containing a CheY-like receiver domain and an HTH DNA-binding domain n=1 Tax=Sphaerochaeta pleomorpha (strain ATCC BAA-1885 / DSM 22778 / Grapes) TaxID=158190 RepID=G8QUD0_SPHPG|nr:response regulator transcription factor [Sphaerochaeta pleomorpha]AEV28100.1 response regulator containing a CheY-like receiver domain and an HTH DNA-binding domain [Sphaerochaeta pleomorpha str. Grapes]
MGQQIEFMIVDDHPLFRQGLVSVIETCKRYTVTGEANTIAEALEIVEAHPPKILLVDISLHHENGLELVKTIHSLHPEMYQLVVSMYDEIIYASNALKSGARGYVMKQEAAETLMQAIETILNGKIYLSQTMHERLLDSLVSQDTKKPETDPIIQLSVRELEVFRMIGQGFGVSEIAEGLNLSSKTINVYRDNIRHKLSIKDAGSLRKYAIKWMQSKDR